MYLENSKTIIVKIGSSLIIDDKKIIRKEWLLEFAKAVSYTHLTLPTIE